LENTGGRLAFLHELGHAKDYAQSPATREEIILSLKNIANKKREEDAWIYARELLDTINSRGIQWFPENFDEKKLEEAINDCIKNHNYSE
jgi:hypothetical protein